MKAWFTTLLLCAQPAQAEQVESKLPQVDPVSASTLSKITLGLVFILLLIFVLAWAMKKMQLTPNANNRLINIVSAISVGHRDRIALIEVGDEQFVVGITPGHIETLHTLKNPVEIPDGPDSMSGGFQDKFKQIMQQGQSHRNKDA